MGRKLVSVGALALAAWLALAVDASADTCHIDGPNDWNLGQSWTCGHVPGPGDDAFVNLGDHPVVTGNPLAEPGSLTISDNGRIVFSNGAALRVGDMTALHGSINGEGSLTVEDSFVKDQVPGGAMSTFFVMNEGLGGKAPDLVLDGPATLEGGAICVGRGDDADPDQPSVVINDTFRITDDPEVARYVFPCTSGPRIRVNPGGHLVVEAGDPTTEFGTMVVNDGTLTAETGKLVLWGGTASETSDGAYVAAEDATLQLGTCCSENFEIGPTGRVGGPGTIVVSGPVTLADGATLDPAVLNLPFQTLVLQGAAPLSLPVVNITGGTLISSRDVTVTDLAVTHGMLQRDFVLTVPADGTFAKTGDGQFFVTNFGAAGSPDLVLDTDASIDGGSFCVGRNGDQDPDLPTVQINQDLTVGAGASTQALGCGSGIAPEYSVNGPDGHLRKTGAGTLQMQNKLGVAGGRLTVAAGQTLVLTNGMTQSSGLTEIASGAVVQGPSGPVAIGGGVLAGAGQISATLAHAGGTVRPAGTLTVDGAYTQGAAGTLQIDLATGAHDRLAVTGAASLAGTLAAVPATGFDPAPAAAFPVVTSGSRTGTLATLTGTRLPGGKRLALEYPGAPDFGARLVVSPPQDLVVTDCGDPGLATLTEVTGDLIIDAVQHCDAVDLPALVEVSGDLIITGTEAGDISLGELGSVAGDLTITGNDAAQVIDLAELASVAGDLTITDNGDATVSLGAPDQVAGDLTLDTAGSGVLDLGGGSPAGNLDLDTVGYGAVSGTTAMGATVVSSSHAEALMRAVLPADAFTAPVRFTISRLDPAALPPEGAVDPVVAYRFEFAVPTLNSPAELTFDIRSSALDRATRDALLAGLADGRATLATRGDAPGSAFQTFPLCAAGEAPAAGGCVRAEQRGGGVVRFTGVAGHFSTWAVAIVAAQGQPPPPPPQPPVIVDPAAPGFGARTLVTLTPAARGIRARGPLRIRVANANAFPVSGRLAGASTKRLGKRRAALRPRSLQVPPRAARTVALKLPKAIRTRLARGRRVALRITATVTDPAGDRRTVTKRITVRRR